LDPVTVTGDTVLKARIGSPPLELEAPSGGARLVKCKSGSPV
jgi:hypothetical protein